MARTTESAVSLIIEVDTSIDLAPFIETAGHFVDLIAGADSTVTDETLELIERWLSAHCYAQRDPRPTSERAGPVSASYQSSVSLRFNNTHYGQMAMALDPTGTLVSLNSSRRTRTVSVTWLGTPYEETEGV